MNVASVASATPSAMQDIWEEIRQEAMRDSQKTVTDSEGQDPSAVSTDIRETGEDEMVALIKRAKAMQQKAGTKASGASEEPETAASAVSTVTTALENVGPNTFERLRSNAGKTYLAQAGNYGACSAAAGEEALGLHKSA